MTSPEWPSTTPVQVQVVGDNTPDIADYAERRLREVFEDTGLPVLHARIRITRHANPARERPVVAQANLDVNGRLVRAQLRATTAREAVDGLRDRLRRRLQRVLQRSTVTRADWVQPAGTEEQEGRPEDDLVSLPSEKQEIVRRKTVTPLRYSLDDAAAYMEDMDYDFHLFIEAGSGQESVLYRSDPTGYRLAQVNPQPQSGLEAHTLPVTVSDHPAPRLSEREAADRMGVWAQPFLFFRNKDNDRGEVLYRRHDGHYGLITPAEQG